jgi:hypothetical protein
VRGQPRAVSLGAGPAPSNTIHAERRCQPFGQICAETLPLRCLAAARRLNAMRGPGENYKDVVIRVVRDCGEGRSAGRKNRLIGSLRRLTSKCYCNHSGRENALYEDTYPWPWPIKRHICLNEFTKEIGA